CEEISAIRRLGGTVGAAVCREEKERGTVTQRAQREEHRGHRGKNTEVAEGRTQRSQRREEELRRWSVRAHPDKARVGHPQGHLTVDVRRKTKSTGKNACATKGKRDGLGPLRSG